MTDKTAHKLLQQKIILEGKIERLISQFEKKTGQEVLLMPFFQEKKCTIILNC